MLHHSVYHEMEEERRICYVAITRAEELLYITNATTRMLFGRSQSNMPSRFLKEIPEISYFPIR
jgi:DNA helicase-2/ATP-dependent DNA helicase PcrA